MKIHFTYCILAYTKNLMPYMAKWGFTGGFELFGNLTLFDKKK